MCVGEGLPNYLVRKVDIGFPTEQYFCAVAIPLFACHKKRRRTVLDAKGVAQTMSESVRERDAATGLPLTLI